jgi:uncharacterized lipoprotein YddW (UPF0748 family)
MVRSPDPKLPPSCYSIIAFVPSFHRIDCLSALPKPLVYPQLKKEAPMSPKFCSSSLLFLALIFLSGCALFQPPREEIKRPEIPPAEREFRGVWVATVANIDWPSKPGLTTEEQQHEAVTILDSVAVLHLNAVILQVRPQCDALYDSKLEPWSYYLTGTQGKAPDPFYDPLTFWVEEAHKRGIELHAWFNPYRAHHPQGGEVTSASIVKTLPGLAKDVGGGTFWLNPTNKRVQDQSYNVVMDVVRRYDIDGVHFDDYFYPYGDGNFPDDDTWTEYKNSGGTLSREDWRRDAVNTFIERLYEGIKKEKPGVKFGISPFGIGRPGNPPSISGFDQYSVLYADAQLWLKKGWIDYWSPQLYWPVNQIPQSFPVLLAWWSRENTVGRNLWPGMIIGRMTDEKGADEIINQIMIERGIVPVAPGHIHFSMKVFLRDSSALNAGLKAGPYRKQALVPPSPWLGDTPPAAPRMSATIADDSTIVLSWSHENAKDVFRYVVYYQYGGPNWEYTILNSQDRMVAIPYSRVVRERPRGRQREENTPPRIEYVTKMAITAVDRLGNESGPSVQNIVRSGIPAAR